MAALIPAALAQAHRSLQPATEREMAVALAKLFDFGAAFGVPVTQPESAARVYAEALRTLPYDLLMTAIDGVIASHRMGMRLPLPAEISAQVSADLARRRSAQAKLEIAQRAPVEARETPPPTDEEIARVDELMANWRRGRGPDPRADQPPDLGSTTRHLGRSRAAAN